jgi:hypothetical protein
MTSWNGVAEIMKDFKAGPEMFERPLDSEGEAREKKDAAIPRNGILDVVKRRMQR